jgi:hypothetical protein
MRSDDRAEWVPLVTWGPRVGGPETTVEAPGCRSERPETAKLLMASRFLAACVEAHA